MTWPPKMKMVQFLDQAHKTSSHYMLLNRELNLQKTDSFCLMAAMLKAVLVYKLKIRVLSFESTPVRNADHISMIQTNNWALSGWRPYGWAPEIKVACHKLGDLDGANLCKIPNFPNIFSTFIASLQRKAILAGVTGRKKG